MSDESERGVTHTAASAGGFVLGWWCGLTVGGLGGTILGSFVASMVARGTMLL